tara:strand:+ start:40 stop:564 length:525 start_codon:yes stop_codon:yes gene_type:complete
MATIYPTVNVTGKPGDGGKGQRNQRNLNAAFPETPVYTDYTNTEAIKSKEDVDGAKAGAIVSGEASTVNDAGVWGLSTVSLEFADAPDVESVETGGAGLPMTPYVPNITSPGEGNANNALATPEYTGDPRTKHNGYGSGLGSTANPAKTSPNIGQATVGSYISGRSYVGSDGRG